MADITHHLVEKSPPREKEYVIWDAEIRGFGLRVAPSGRKTFIYKYRTIDGLQRKPTLGVVGRITLSQAREAAHRIQAELHPKHLSPQSSPLHSSAITVSQICDRYLDEHATRRKQGNSLRNDELWIRRAIKPFLGSLLATDLTLQDVTNLHRSMANTPYAANRTVALLSKILNLCETWGFRQQGSNPCVHIERYPEKRRTRILSEIEIYRLARTLSEAEKSCIPGIAENPRIIAALRLMLFTGMRPGQVLCIRWSDVELQDQLIWIDDAQGRQQAIPISSAALQILRTQRRIPEHPFVFPGRKRGRPLTDIKRPWYRLRTRARLGDLRLQDLRRTFAATAANGNITLYQLSQLLGLSSRESAAPYRDLLKDPKLTAADNVVSLFSDAIKKKKNFPHR